MKEPRKMHIEPDIDLAFIGGSGLYNLDNFNMETALSIDTPYGKTSSEIITGKMYGRNICFIPRHGKTHSLLPSEVPFAANIWALKSIGITKLIGVSAVGSLQKDIKPLDMVIPNQLIDNTNRRVSSFFGKGVVAHVSMSDPFCSQLSETLTTILQSENMSHHSEKTLVVIEGPQFSTYAESHMYRKLGGHIIGMTTAQESKLAREAEICYSSIAMVTDYDCWNKNEEPVTSQIVISNLKQNVTKVQRLIKNIVKTPVLTSDACACKDSLSNALIKDRLKLDSSLIEKLNPIVKKYIN